MNKALSALAAAGLALTLVGCSYNPGQAAVVDGVGISDAAITQTAEAIARSEQLDAGKLRAAIVSNETQGLVASVIAKANNLPLSDATRGEVIKSNQVLTKLQSVPEASTFINRAADAIYVSTKLGEDKFLTGCQQVPVQLNPRYGTWSKEQCSITPGGDVLARDAATPAPQR